MAVLTILALAADPGSAQTAPDTLDVVNVAFDSIVGPPPYAHPGGSTRLVCLETFEGSAGARLSLSQLGGLKKRLSDTLGLSIGQGCYSVPRRPASWVFDQSGRPAVVVRIRAPTFATPDTASVTISELGGGNPRAETTKCSVVRDHPGAPFKLQNCEVSVVIGLSRSDRSRPPGPRHDAARRAGGSPWDL